MSLRSYPISWCPISFERVGYEEEEEEQEEGENLAAEEAVVDGILFRDTIANEMWEQCIAYCLANVNN